ncbi:Bax inhibitor-1 like-protein [Coccomyxa subellipsoidea C-169]|uniref:Bax inhibitor-1 like-protein n=1 Tax=Coccomyxa subellipsoidea (strain C-169) TaxID=574566 RepID=I0YP79_COCSC|nr:Bax inhibitor-1 like-protein [Coccomyxa subellipsoidea C-169]EIE20198.1 Bax inhibitor-1 like-protein [Coccomyxa subellipsoidea C-169]|eukprot:XP_005644742.1 Bax inhibitor-1 like-protein [Coccomyxa subellipsoidea C-169]
MDFVDRFTSGSAAQRFSPDTLFKFTDLTVPVQKHLEKVYLTLSAALLIAAVGTYVNILTGLGGFVAAIGFVVCATWLTMTEPNAYNLNKRYALLAGAAFSQGLTLGPLISMVLAVHPGILFTAFLATAASFACFSGAAMLSRRRSWLYLSGTLSSAMSIMLVMRLATWMFGGRALAFQLELYGGLAVFLGYILLDTQVIIEKAYQGNKDHIRGALDLFVDFMAIFVRLLVILMQNAEKKEERRERKRR